MRQLTSSPASAGASLPAALREGVENLSPAYFGMVMATGIVSIALHLLGAPGAAAMLFWLNLATYAILWTLTLLRIAGHRRRFLEDLTDHNRGPGFFTSVAATCIVGTQFIMLCQAYRAAMVLWAIGVVLWIILTYAIFTVFTIKENKPSLAEGITGAWLLAVVATQSVAVLSALIAAHLEQPYRIELNFCALSMWLWGGMLYIWMISLIFYRYTFFRFSPGDLAPPYWINMGAMAISTLAGSVLILHSPDAPFIRSLLPFLKGFTVFYWATGTWWIPMLFILGVWRHVYRGFPLTYDPLYWGAVFPLGMYTVCTFQAARAMDLPFLYVIPKYFIFVALAAWLAAFAGLLRGLVRTIAAAAAPGRAAP